MGWDEAGAGRPEPLRGPDGRRQPETGYRAGEADGDDDRVRELRRPELPRGPY